MGKNKKVEYSQNQFGKFVDKSGGLVHTYSARANYTGNRGSEPTKDVIMKNALQPYYEVLVNEHENPTFGYAPRRPLAPRDFDLIITLGNIIRDPFFDTASSGGNVPSNLEEIRKVKSGPDYLQNVATLASTALSNSSRKRSLAVEGLYELLAFFKDISSSDLRKNAGYHAILVGAFYERMSQVTLTTNNYASVAFGNKSLKLTPEKDWKVEYEQIKEKDQSKFEINI